MINPEQENALGELMAGKQLMATRSIELEEFNAPLQTIVNRLTAVAPPSSTRFRVRIIESSNANAYAFLGGQILVTRKALLVARNEDEIAGLLAHEMGHTLTRQTARDYEQLLQAVLNVKRLDPKDTIEDRYHEFLEKVAIRPNAYITALIKIAERSDKEQIEADQVSLYLLNRAGYKPEAFIEYFDRLTGNKGNVGSGWSDFFHTTRPESRRLREMLKTSAVMPEACKQPAGHLSSDEFSKWQTALKAYSGFGKTDNVPGGHPNILKDPLRSDIAQLQFSPDGNYIIAQDSASVYVLSREPFTTLFRFDTEDAHAARFTPDSKNVVFVTDSGRVEKWSVEQKAQVGANEVHILHPCIQLTLSPTGEYIACVRASDKGWYPLQLDILDVSTGEPIWTQKGVERERSYAFSQRLRYLPPEYIWMEFSPDGKYLAASGDTGPILFDMENKSPAAISPALSKLMKRFMFLSNEQILSFNYDPKSIGTVAKFPSGEFVAEFPLPRFPVSRTSTPGILAVRPYINSAAALVEISKQTILVKSQTRALDIFDNFYVAEARTGQLALYDTTGKRPKILTTLPKGHIVHFEAISFSKDGRYLTYSDFSRGGLWKVDDGTRLSLVRGFRGAYFDGDNQLLVLFPPATSYQSTLGISKEEAESMNKGDRRAEESKKIDSAIVQLSVANDKLQELRLYPRRYSVTQHGNTAVVFARADEHGDRVTTIDYEFHDVTTGQTLWTRNFGADPPALYYNPVGSTVVLGWNADTVAAEPLLKQDPQLAATVDSYPKGKEGALLLEVLDERTGKRRFSLPIDTGRGSFRITDVDVVGNTLVYSDSVGRLVVYNSTGKRLGRIFGQRPALDRTGELLAAQVEPGRLVLYRVSDMHKFGAFTFSARLAHFAFSADSKKLFVLTSDQNVWTIDIAK